MDALGEPRLALRCNRDVRQSSPRSLTLAIVLLTLGACTPQTVAPVESASRVETASPAVTARTAATPSPTPRAFAARAGAVNPIAAATSATTQDFAHVQLAASAAPVTIHFVNGLPQSISVLDDKSGADLYHVGSRYGPGHPTVDEGFLQVFLAQLHNDTSQQLVLAYGNCSPACTGASQLMVISMNAEHQVVIEQLRLNGLTDAVAEARDGLLLVSQWQAGTIASVRQFKWDVQLQGMAEQ